MKKIYLILLFSLSLTAEAQIGLKSLINKTSFDNAKSIIPLSISNSEYSTSGVFSEGSSPIILELRQSELEKVNLSDKVLKISLPLDKKNLIEVQVVEVNIFSPDFQTLNGTGEVTSHSTIRNFHGIISGDENSIVALSIFEEGFSGSIISGKGSYSISQIQNSSFYTIVESEDLINSIENFCSTIYSEQSEISSPNTTSGVVGCKLVNVSLITDYQVYLNRSSNPTLVENYVVSLFNIVVAIYKNENIGLSLSSLQIYDYSDPFYNINENNTSNILNHFINTLGTNFNGNIAHLISFRSFNGGIAAGLNTLCNKNLSHSISFINNFNSLSNTNIYNVQVFSHELGHNLGSPHTHDCAWNGNNTPIDNCGPNAGYPGWLFNNFNLVSSANCNSTGSTPPFGGGTIMSYCHSTSIGRNVSNGFGPQPGNIMRQRVAECNQIATNYAVPSTPSEVIVGYNYVLLTWVHTVTSTNYTVRFRRKGASNWTLYSTDLNNLEVYNLDEGTEYEWQVGGDCSAGVFTSIRSFTTFSNLQLSMTLNKSSACLNALQGIIGTIQTSNGQLGSSNVFTVELSDSQGTFNNPSVISSSSQVSHTLDFSGVLVSGSYKIRAKSSSPLKTGNELSFTINALPVKPTLTFNKPRSLCSGENIQINANCPSQSSVQWNDVNYSGSQITYINNSNTDFYVKPTCLSSITGCQSEENKELIIAKPNPNQPSVSFLKCPVDFISQNSTNIGNGFANDMVASRDGSFLASYFGDDFRVQKVSSTGVVYWDKSFGESGLDRVNKILEDINGDLLLVGYSNSNVSGNKSENSKGGTDIWLVKTSQTGDIIWDKTIGGSGMDYATDAIRTQDGGFIIIGSSTSSTSGDILSDASSRNGNPNLLLIKFNKNGEKEWDKLYWSGMTNGDFAKGILSKDGNIYVSSNTTTSTNTDFWLLKLNQSGDIILNRTYDRDLYDSPKSIVELPNNVIVMTGRTGVLGSNAYTWNLWIDGDNGNIKINRVIGSSSISFHGEKNFLSSTSDLLVIAQDIYNFKIYVYKYDFSGNRTAYIINGSRFLGGGYGNGVTSGKGEIFFIGTVNLGGQNKSYLNRITECHLKTNKLCQDIYSTRMIIKASGCEQNYLWSDGTTPWGEKSTINSNQVYQVKCQDNGCLGDYSSPKSINYVNSSLFVKNDNEVDKNEAVNFIISEKNNYTSQSKEFIAGRNIELWPGFETGQNQTFKVEIKTCVD